jgi:hypothetical protein
MNTSFVRRLKIAITLLAIVISPTSAETESQLTRFHETFMERYDEINQQLADAETSLADGYLKALNRLREKIQAEGIIEKVLPIRDEITAIENRVSPLPQIPATASSEFKQLRETYQKSLEAARKKHAAALVPLADKMIQLVNTESESLTKAGKLDEALVAQHMAKTLEEDPKITAARMLVAPPPGITTGPWLNLAKADFVIDSSAIHYVGPVEGEGGKGKISGNIARWSKTIDENSKEVFLTCSGGKITFQLERSASQVKGDLATFHSRAAYTIRIMAGKRLVGEIQVNGSIQSKPFEFTFSASDQIVFEIVDSDQASHVDFGLLRQLKFR